MIEDALPFDTIVFVCAHQRGPGERVACANAGRDGQALLDTLKAAVKARGWETRVRISKSGCVDRCEEGPNVVVVHRAQKAVWFHGVSLDDAPQILARAVPAELLNS